MGGASLRCMGEPAAREAQGAQARTVIGVDRVKQGVGQRHFVTDAEPVLHFGQRIDEIRGLFLAPEQAFEKFGAIARFLERDASATPRVRRQLTR